MKRARHRNSIASLNINYIANYFIHALLDNEGDTAKGLCIVWIAAD